MTNRDYTKEVGIDTAVRIVPMRYAIAIIVAIVVAAGFGFATLRPKAPTVEKKAAAQVSSGSSLTRGQG